MESIRDLAGLALLLALCAAMLVVAYCW